MWKQKIVSYINQNIYVPDKSFWLHLIIYPFKSLAYLHIIEVYSFYLTKFLLKLNQVKLCCKLYKYLCLQNFSQHHFWLDIAGKTQMYLIKNDHIPSRWALWIILVLCSLAHCCGLTESLFAKFPVVKSAVKKVCVSQVATCVCKYSQVDRKWHQVSH